MSKFALTLIAFAFSFLGFAQSFKDIKELISLSVKEPLELETTLNNKGFTFNGKKSERYGFYRIDERVSYELLPRAFQYSFTSRHHYLSFFSGLKKLGFSVSTSEVQLLDSKEKRSATLFAKKQMEIYLIDLTKGNDHEYSILIYPGPYINESNVNSLYKNDISFVGIHASTSSAGGVLSENPSETTSYQQDFNGESGMGIKRAYGLEISGISGLKSLNRKLPYFVDFGISLGTSFNVQPFSYESLGAPFDEFKYDAFMRAGLGGGPAILLSPFRNTDFRITFYYDFVPSVNFGGGLRYQNTTYNYEENVLRDKPSFTLVKAYGASIKYKSVIFSVQKSAYFDKANYTLSSGYNGILSQTKFNSNLFFDYLTFKLGVTF